MKTREIVKAVLFVAGIILTSASCNKDDGPTLDFNITVPSDWKYYILSNGNVVYYAQSPLKTLSDTVSEDLVITKEDTKDMSLTSYYNLYIDVLNNDSTYHPISAIDTTINGE